MSYTEATVQLLSPQGTLVENDLSAGISPASVTFAGSDNLADIWEFEKRYVDRP